jgi:hypothetical protein
MTTLRTFQNEIHEIRNREVSKQRLQLNPDKDKEARKHTNLKGKVKEDLPSSTVQTQTESGRCETESDRAGLQLQEIEEQILVRRDHHWQL